MPTVLISRSLVENIPAVTALESQLDHIEPVALTKGLYEVTSKVLVSPDDEDFYDTCVKALSSSTSHGQGICTMLGRIEHFCITASERRIVIKHPLVEDFLLEQMHKPSNGHTPLLMWDHGRRNWLNVN